MDTSRDADVVPIIKRARGFRLYDARGGRYLDLYRDGGGALLGHRSGTTITLMKSVLSQGLLTAVPSVWEGRLIRVIASMFPARSNVRLFSSLPRALEAVSLFLGMRVDPSDVHDPAIHTVPRGRPRACFWRPFLPEEESGAAACAAVLPILPLTVCGAPAPVCFPDGPSAGLPASDRLPGFVLAGASSALAAVRSPRRVGHLFQGDPVIQRAVDSSSRWARTGPYVRAVFAPGEYSRVFAEFLRAGVLLSPEYPGPSILPGECSPGEARRAAELFITIPGG
ncbi:MAG: hypothetical protein ABSG38_03480 [Spirochaetia bacterium]|jgi:hypothetical protein